MNKSIAIQVSDLDLMKDFANARIRYPLAALLVPMCVRWKVSPNYISISHTVLGVFTAYLLVSVSDSLLPLIALLYEFRGILDCLDGLVARARRVSSDFGRVLDMVGDGINYVAFAIACLLREPYALTWAVFGLTVSIAVFALVYEFYRGLFESIAKKTEWDVLRRLRQAEGKSISLGILFDRFQLVVFAGLPWSRHRQPHLKHYSESLAMDMNQNPDKFRRSLRLLALLTGDNLLLLVNVGLLLSRLDLSFVFSLAFSFVVGAFGWVAFRRRVRVDFSNFKNEVIL